MIWRSTRWRAEAWGGDIAGVYAVAVGVAKGVGPWGGSGRAGLKGM